MSVNAAAITIVGLGPGARGDLTLAAWEALVQSPRVLLRTRRHPCVEEIPFAGEVSDCDDLYEKHAEFADVYAAIVERVCEMGSLPGGVVYAVPGHPWVGEATTPRILERARSSELSVQVIGGLSFVEPSFAAVDVDLMDGAQVVDAMILAREYFPRVDPGLPLLVAQVYANWLAADLKLTLLNAYPPEHSVSILTSAGDANQRIVGVPLFALDRSENQFDHRTSVYVPPLEYGGSFTDLQEIVAHLRAPEGCPWDREQTLASLRKDLLGECAEVLEAIDAEEDGSDASVQIAEELGDLILSATMMVQIATEEGRFQMADALRGIVTKLIRRHPHVFGDTEVDGVEGVLVNWDAIKAQEKAEKGLAPHPLDGIPAALPALEKARELQSKAAKAGLLDRSELAHADAAVVDALGLQPDEARFAEVLWQLVALGREHGVNAEDALRAFTVTWRRAHGWAG